MAATRRFKAQPPRIQTELQATLRKMGATNLVVSQNFDTSECVITFDRSGQRYIVRCQKWQHPTDNFRAAQRAISLVYQAIEEAGITRTRQHLADTFGQFFAGWAATPDDRVLALPSGSADWWVVLGVKSDATPGEIRNAYLALSRVHHPDAGGDAAAFRRLRRAYDEANKARGAA